MESGSQAEDSTSQPLHDTAIVRCFLRPLVSLDAASLQKLEDLLKIIRGDTHQATHTAQATRSPGARGLRATLDDMISKVNNMATSIGEIASNHRSVPGIDFVHVQFKAFQDALTARFNDGNDLRVIGQPGRDSFLQELMYTTGILQGHLEMVIEQHAYWKAKLAGTKPRSVARRLNFNKKADPAASASLSFGPPALPPSLTDVSGPPVLLPSLTDVSEPPVLSSLTDPSFEESHHEETMSSELKLQTDRSATLI